MLSLASLWLAGAAVIALVSLWAKANRRSGWRRERPGTEVTSVRELLELYEQVRQGGEKAPLPLTLPARSQPPVSSPDSASLIALQAALSPAGFPQETPPQEPQRQTAPAGVASP